MDGATSSAPEDGMAPAAAASSGRDGSRGNSDSTGERSGKARSGVGHAAGEAAAGEAREAAAAVGEAAGEATTTGEEGEDGRQSHRRSSNAVGSGTTAKQPRDAAHVPRHGQQRIRDGLATLDSKKAQSIEHTTSVRVEADEMENRRRIEEEERRQDRLWRLQEEAASSGRANAAVEMRWNDLGKHSMPQDLHDALEEQKAACARIIASKEQIIQEFKVCFGVGRVCRCVTSLRVVPFL